jgi:hypothetical protein
LRWLSETPPEDQALTIAPPDRQSVLIVPTSDSRLKRQHIELAFKPCRRVDAGSSVAWP